MLARVVVTTARWQTSAIAGAGGCAVASHLVVPIGVPCAQGLRVSAVLLSGMNMNWEMHVRFVI